MAFWSAACVSCGACWHATVSKSKARHPQKISLEFFRVSQRIGIVNPPAQGASEISMFGISDGRSIRPLNSLAMRFSTEEWQSSCDECCEQPVAQALVVSLRTISLCGFRFYCSLQKNTQTEVSVC